MNYDFRQILDFLKCKILQNSKLSLIRIKWQSKYQSIIENLIPIFRISVQYDFHHCNVLLY